MHIKHKHDVYDDKYIIMQILVPNLISFFITKVPQKVLVTKYGCILLQVVDLPQFVHYFRIYFMSQVRYSC